MADNPGGISRIVRFGYRGATGASGSGAFHVKRGGTSLPQRDTLQILGADESTLYDGGDATVLDLSDVGGNKSNGVALGAVSAGQFLCTASFAGDATKLRAATPANLSVAGHVVGIALADALDGARVTYAPVGHVVAISGFVPPSSGKPTHVVLDATAHAVLRNVPLQSDYMGGIADGSRGYITIDPMPPHRTHVNICAAPYLAKGDGTTDDTDAIQRAIDDVLAASPSTPGCVYFPNGNYKVTRPLWIAGGVHLLGESEIGSVIFTSGVSGPALLVQGDTSDLVHYVPSSLGGNALRLGPLVDGGDGLANPQFPLNDVAALRVNGLNALSIEASCTVRNGTNGPVFKSVGILPDGAVGDTAFELSFTDTASPGTMKTLVNVTGLGIAGFYGPDVEIGVRHTYGLHYGGGVVALSIDGVIVQSTPAFGAITQFSWENVGIGHIPFSFPEGPSGFSPPDVDIDFIRVSNTATPTAIPGGAKASWVPAETLFLCTFPDLDPAVGPFLKAKCDIGGGEYDTYIPITQYVSHFGHETGNGALHKLTVTANQGTACRVEQHVKFRAESVTFGGIHGLRMRANCFDGRIEQCVGVGLLAGYRKGTTGFVNGVLANGTQFVNCRSAGFNFGYIGAGFGSLDGGRCGGPYLEGGITIVNWDILNTHRCANYEIDEEDNADGTAPLWRVGLFRAINVTLDHIRSTGFRGGSHIELNGCRKVTIRNCDFECDATTPATAEIIHCNQSYPCATEGLTIVDCTKTALPGGGGPGPDAIPWTLDATLPLVVEPRETSGRVTVTYPSDADLTLTAEQMTYRDITIAAGSLTSAKNLIAPTRAGWVRSFHNTTAYVVTVKTAAGTGVAMPAGSSRLLSSDGTNVVDVLSGLGGWTAGGDLSGTSTSQQVTALTGTTDTSAQLGRVAQYAGVDLNDGVVVQRGGIQEYVIARDAGAAGIYYEDSAPGFSPYAWEVGGQCANAADAGSNFAGGDLRLRGGSGVGTGASGRAGLYNAAATRGVDIGDDCARAIADQAKFGVAPTSLGTISGHVAGTTTSSTSADQTIATLAIPSNGSWTLTVRIVERVGNTQTETGQSSITIHWNGSVFSASTSKNSDLSDNSITPQLTLSSPNVLVKATPVSASSATHKVTYEWQAG